MELIQVKAYQYSELSDNSQNKVKSWLDENPVEFADDEDNLYYECFSDWDSDTQNEHCESNGYLFAKDGEPIHYLIVESEVE